MQKVVGSSPIIRSSSSESPGNGAFFVVRSNDAGPVSDDFPRLGKASPQRVTIFRLSPLFGESGSAHSRTREWQASFRRQRSWNQMSVAKSLRASIQGDPVFMRRVNGWLTLFGVAMIPVSYELGWLKSVAFVSALSLWALVAGHWSSW
jgi:hypothetical protein